MSNSKANVRFVIVNVISGKSYVARTDVDWGADDGTERVITFDNLPAAQSFVKEFAPAAIIVNTAETSTFAPVSGKCKGTNKSGCQCKRNATYAGFCWQHAKTATKTITPKSQPVAITPADLNRLCVCCNERTCYDLDAKHCHFCLKNILDSRDMVDADTTPTVESTDDEIDVDGSVNHIMNQRDEAELLRHRKASIENPLHIVGPITPAETSSPTHTESTTTTQPVIISNLDSLKGLARYHALRNACKVAGLNVVRGMKADQLYDMLAKHNAPLIGNGESRSTVTTESTGPKSTKCGPTKRKTGKAKKAAEVITAVVSTPAATQETTFVEPVAKHTVDCLTIAEMRATSVARIVEALDGIKTFDKAAPNTRMRIINTIRRNMLNGASLVECVDAFKAYTSAAEFVIDCE